MKYKNLSHLSKITVLEFPSLDMNPGGAQQQQQENRTFVSSLLPPRLPHLSLALITDSYMKRAITCASTLCCTWVIIKLDEIESISGDGSSPNHDVCSHPFLAHISIFPLIQSSECGRKWREVFFGTGIPEFSRANSCMLQYLAL